MASLSLNNVLGVRLDWRDRASDSMFMNQLHFRVQSGEVPYDQDFMDALSTNFLAGLAQKISNNLPDSVYLRQMSCQKIGPTLDVRLWTNYTYATRPGDLTQDIGETLDWRMAACLTRYSFKTGRSAIGHVYIGPLLSRFRDGLGALKLDPILGGDLNDIETSQRADQPVVVGTTTVNLRPIVCKQPYYTPEPEHVYTPPTIDDQNDIRLQQWALYPSFLRTRKPGRGG